MNSLYAGLNILFITTDIKRTDRQTALGKAELLSQFQRFILRQASRVFHLICTWVQHSPETIFVFLYSFL